MKSFLKNKKYLFNVCVITLCSLALPFTPLRADDLTQTCGSNPGSGPTTQQTQYCQAASTASQGSNANEMSGHLWAAVAVVCTAACMSPAGQATSSSASATPCGESQIGAGIASGVMAKNLESSFTSVANTLGGNSLANLTGSKPATPPSGTPSDNNNGANNKKSACISAATSAAQAIQHYQAQAANNATLDSSLKDAKELIGAQAVSAPGSSSDPSPTNGAVSSAATAGSPFSTSGICTAAKTSGNSAAYVQCAAAADPNIPAFTNTPGFANDFQNISGQSLPQFLSQSGNPAQNIASAAAKSVGTDAALQVGSAIAEAETLTNTPTNAGYGVYASIGGSGGGAGKNRAGSADPNISDLMAGLLGQLSGGKDGDMPGGTSVMNFTRAYRNPANVAENRDLSIFDRVSYRYLLVNTRLR